MDKIWTRSLPYRSEALNLVSLAPVEMKGHVAGEQALAGSCQGLVMHDLILGLYEQAGLCRVGFVVWWTVGFSPLM